MKLKIMLVVNNIWIIWTSFFLCFGFIGCNQTSTTTNRPEKLPFKDPPEPQLSEINLPIIYHLNDINDKINAEIPPVVYEDTSFEDNNRDNLKYKLIRRGDLTVNIDGEDLLVKIPAEIEGTGRLKSDILGFQIDKEQDIDFAVDIYLRTQIALNKDWQLVTETSVDHLDWIRKPEIQIGPIKIQLHQVIELVLNQNESLLLNQVDGAANKHLKLKESLEKLWNDIQKPILVDRKTEKLWVVPEPQSVSMSPVKGTSDYLYTYARIKAYMYAYLSDKPQVDSLVPLPGLLFHGESNPTFELSLYGKLTYGAINEILKDSLIGKKFGIDDHSIVIKDAIVFGNGNKVVVETKVSGDVKANIYLEGVPVYDKQRMGVYLDSVEFTLDSKETMVSMADWLFHDEFKDIITKYIYIPLEKEIESIPEKVEEGIEKGKLGEKIGVRLNTITIEPREVVVRPEGIHVVIYSMGKASITIEHL